MIIATTVIIIINNNSGMNKIVRKVRALVTLEKYEIYIRPYHKIFDVFLCVFIYFLLLMSFLLVKKFTGVHLRFIKSIF